jgi:hypothetical protein
VLVVVVQLLTVVFELEEYHYYIDWKRADEGSTINSVDEIKQ